MITFSGKISLAISALIVAACGIFGYFIMTGKSESGIAASEAGSAPGYTAYTVTQSTAPPGSPDMTPGPSHDVTPSPQVLIYIHVDGAVANPGLISLPDGKRVADAIEAAGGLTGSSDISDINLAMRLSDGMKIYVPAKGETAFVITPFPYQGNAHPTDDHSEENKIVNINTADKDELMTLSGIGATTADKIIAYRNENGNFVSPEDIMSVSGIGRSKYEAIKDMICV